MQKFAQQIIEGHRSSHKTKSKILCFKQYFKQAKIIIGFLLKKKIKEFANMTLCDAITMCQTRRSQFYVKSCPELGQHPSFRVFFLTN
jgi:hypothetical protein